MKDHTTRHHRKPTSIGGTSDPRNLSFVSEEAHRAWHRLFYNLDAESIAAIVNRTWLDPDFVFIAQRKEDAHG